jgi:hypothetical protein
MGAAEFTSPDAANSKRLGVAELLWEFVRRIVGIEFQRSKAVASVMVDSSSAELLEEINSKSEATYLAWVLGLSICLLVYLPETLDLDLLCNRPTLAAWFGQFALTKCEDGRFVL